MEVARGQSAFILAAFDQAHQRPNAEDWRPLRPMASKYRDGGFEIYWAGIARK
jgi:hypothetical protein